MNKTNKRKYGYKVVMKEQDSDALISCFVYPGVVYRLGKWTKPHPKDGPLAVCPTMEAVRTLLRDLPLGQYLVYLAEWRPWSEKLPRPTGWPKPAWFWHKWHCCYGWPGYATRLAKAVRLVELVDTVQVKE